MLENCADDITCVYWPDNGRYVLRNNVKLFNDMVVPYNPALLLKYNCHINVEVVSTIRAVKYQYKYVLKGGTRAAVTTTATSLAANAGVEGPEPEPDDDGVSTDFLPAVTSAMLLRAVCGRSRYNGRCVTDS